MDADLDTLATARYVTADDLLKAWSGLAPSRPVVGIASRLTDIESINDTFKGQLDIERHGGRSSAGVIAQVMQRILALTTAIWCNDKLGLPIHRSLTAYDH